MGIDRRKPDWLRIKVPHGSYSDIKESLDRYSLATVCTEAQCPNKSECWSAGTATFLIMGHTCTRHCGFCNVKTGQGEGIDPTEPQRIVNFLSERKFDYVVLTSVDRDDLPDQGAGHFAACVRAIKDWNHNMGVEVLTPDFSDDKLGIVVRAGPDVIGHNIEVVERIFSSVRDRRADYRRSLGVLRRVKEIEPRMLTKSSIMVGLGESAEEVTRSLSDLKEAGVDIVTIGQYLQPSKRNIDVVEYVTPEQFSEYEGIARSMGFRHVMSGPFVRSSYMAGKIVMRQVI